MPGMSGEEEEQPASSNAVRRVSQSHLETREQDVHSNMIAIAIRIMRTWW